MRKISSLITFLVLSLICTTSFAQENKETTATVQQQQIEIHLDQVPEAITKALIVDYKGYSVGKVFTSSKNGQYIYSIQLFKDGEAIEVNYNAEGAKV
jgi:ABC-type proline/glycine betaine transport system substrate-binding protein